MAENIDSSAWTGRGPSYTGRGLPAWLWPTREEREFYRFIVRIEIVSHATSAPLPA